MDSLVSTSWLAENLASVLIFDASYYLPVENVDPVSRFRDEHIPGARFFDVDRIADADATLPHMAPTAARFEKLMAALGISNDDRIVFYDQKGIFSAPRAWWLMRLFGHESVAVLDGGLPAWKEEGRPLENGDATPPARGQFAARLHARRLRGLGDVWANIDEASELLLDARAKGRFDGSAPEPRPELPSGHVPGAHSLPAGELLRDGRYYLQPAALQARFAKAGVDGTKPVVTSCGSGITAAILTLGLHVAGFAEGALYDGSWTEWASQPDTPKART